MLAMKPFNSSPAVAVAQGQSKYASIHMASTIPASQLPGREPYVKASSFKQGTFMDQALVAVITPPPLTTAPSDSSTYQPTPRLVTDVLQPASTLSTEASKRHLKILLRTNARSRLGYFADIDEGHFVSLIDHPFGGIFRYSEYYRELEALEFEKWIREHVLEGLTKAGTASLNFLPNEKAYYSNTSVIDTPKTVANPPLAASIYHKRTLTHRHDPKHGLLDRLQQDCSIWGFLLCEYDINIVRQIEKSCYCPLLDTTSPEFLVKLMNYGLLKELRDKFVREEMEHRNIILCVLAMELGCNITSEFKNYLHVLLDRMESLGEVTKKRLQALLCYYDGAWMIYRSFNNMVRHKQRNENVERWCEFKPRNWNFPQPSSWFVGTWKCDLAFCNLSYIADEDKTRKQYMTAYIPNYESQGIMEAKVEQQVKVVRKMRQRQGWETKNTKTSSSSKVSYDISPSFAPLDVSPSASIIHPQPLNDPSTVESRQPVLPDPEIWHRVDKEAYKLQLDKLTLNQKTKAESWCAKLTACKAFEIKSPWREWRDRALLSPLTAVPYLDEPETDGEFAEAFTPNFLDLSFPKFMTEREYIAIEREKVINHCVAYFEQDFRHGLVPVGWPDDEDYDFEDILWILEDNYKHGFTFMKHIEKGKRVVVLRSEMDEYCIDGYTTDLACTPTELEKITNKLDAVEDEDDDDDETEYNRDRNRLFAGAGKKSKAKLKARWGARLVAAKERWTRRGLPHPYRKPSVIELVQEEEDDVEIAWNIDEDTWKGLWETLECLKKKWAAAYSL